MYTHTRNPVIVMMMNIMRMNEQSTNICKTNVFTTTADDTKSARNDVILYNQSNLSTFTEIIFPITLSGSMLS